MSARHGYDYRAKNEIMQGKKQFIIMNYQLSISSALLPATAQVVSEPPDQV